MIFILSTLKKRISNSTNDIKKSDIKIGRNCFIGMNTIILKGSVIEDNSIVGAGSIVSGKFKSNSNNLWKSCQKIKENFN